METTGSTSVSASPQLDGCGPAYEAPGPPEKNPIADSSPHIQTRSNSKQAAIASAGGEEGTLDLRNQSFHRAPKQRSVRVVVRCIPPSRVLRPPPPFFFVETPAAMFKSSCPLVHRRFHARARGQRSLELVRVGRHGNCRERQRRQSEDCCRGR